MLTKTHKCKYNVNTNLRSIFDKVTLWEFMTIVKKNVPCSIYQLVILYDKNNKKIYERVH